MFGALKRGFRSTASLILVRNVVGELQPKRTLAASRGFLAAAWLSCSKLLSESDSWFFLDVSICPPTLNRRSTAAEDGSVVLNLANAAFMLLSPLDTCSASLNSDLNPPEI